MTQSVSELHATFSWGLKVTTVSWNAQESPKTRSRTRKIDPTRNPTSSAQTRNALGQDDALDC